MKTSSHFHMEHVLSYDSSEQRHLAQQGALELGRQAAFRMTQVAAETGEGLSPAMKELSLWLKKRDRAVLRLFVAAPAATNLAAEGMTPERLHLVGSGNARTALEELNRQSREFCSRGGLVGLSLVDSLIFAGCALVAATVPAHMHTAYRCEETA